MHHDAHRCTAVEIVAKHDGEIADRLTLTAEHRAQIPAWVAQQLARARVLFLHFLPCQAEEPVAGAAWLLQATPGGLRRGAV